MACKKSELVDAINAFASARVSGDKILQTYSSNLVLQYIETLEFTQEEEADDNQID